MKRATVILLTAATIGCDGPAVAAFAAPKAAAAQALSAAEEEALRLASARGALLYAYDQAAWHGTDAMLVRVADAQTKVGGWIVDGPGDSPELVFFDKNEAAPRAVFVADFRGGKLVSSRVAAADEPELSAARKQMIAARAAALAALQAKGFERCSKESMNTVVLPPTEPGGPTLVYVLTPQPDMNTIPFGGHYRISVGADGKVGEVRPFTNSCIAVPRNPPAAGGTPAAVVITHLLDPVPTEIHVFSSLVARVPVLVGTKDGRVWGVAGSTIRLLTQVKR